jgi:catechol 2,3-dioxygenase-like lactoylglutathione lyase family enzyme
MVSALESVTVGVSRLDEALRLFRDTLGLRAEADFAAGPALCAAWGLPSGQEARVVELSLAGYPVVRLRVVQYAPGATAKVRVHHGDAAHDAATDIGPKAIDFYIPPPARRAFDLVTRAGFATRSPPIRHEVGDTVSEEFVFWGPDGVPLLVMVGHRHGPDQMRRVEAPFSEVATVSVVGGEPAATRRFYGGALGMRALLDTWTAPEFLDLANELTGTPRGTPIHWLLYAEPGEPSGKILVVHFAGAAGRRLAGRMRPGHLGFSLMTQFAPDLDALERELRAAGGRIMTPPVEVPWHGGTRRIMLAHGPNEELFEFVEGAVVRNARS